MQPNKIFIISQRQGSLVRSCSAFTDDIHCFDDCLAAYMTMADMGWPDIVMCDFNTRDSHVVKFLHAFSEAKKWTGVILLSETHHDILPSIIDMLRLNQVDVRLLSGPMADGGALVCTLQSLLMMQGMNVDKQVLAFEPTRAQLLEALSCGHIQPYFQPQITINNGRLMGAEALARWEHADLGLLAPAQFMDAIRRHDLLNRLSEVILDASLQFAKKWCDAGHEIRVSVNVSADQIADEHYPERVVSLLAKYLLPSSCLCIEITEDERHQYASRTLAGAARLRLHGIALSLDDFGKGHASLFNLIRNPVTELKIDRAFISRMLDDPRHYAAVKTSISIAQSLGLQTVAEGVENIDQIHALKALGCHCMQGFYFSPAISSRHFYNCWS